MTDKHPYISGAGPLTKAIEHLRSSLPPTINASIIKKLGLAPQNESYLINTLQFIKVIDEEGSPTEKARSVFSQHEDASFAKEFSMMVEEAYSDLFLLHGKKAWSLDLAALVTFFRQADKTSAVVGKRQAKIFQTLAALSGHGEIIAPRTPSPRKEKPDKQAKKQEKKKAVSPKDSQSTTRGVSLKNREMGLTVRIEINLPASGDQETYDRIFKSIRENLLNA